MNQYKICVYAICKNEEPFVDRWMDSVCEADLVVVLDTGSTDNTVDKLKNRGASVFTEIIDPWRFDTARNVAMSHIPKDVDICVSVDLDEVFRPGWRKKLEMAWKPEYTRAKYLYIWNFNEDGSPGHQFPREKIHSRQGFQWIHPVHEVLNYSGTRKDKTVFVEELVLCHYPDLKKSRDQYLPLLELSARENPLDDRTLFWLGREYMYHEKYDLAIETLEKHLALPSAAWDEERSASMRFIAVCHEAKGDRRLACQWLYRAIAECPKIREPYLKLAELGYFEKNWPLVYAMAEAALNITERNNSYLTEPESWNYAPYDYAAISAFHLGLYEKARDYAKKACEYDENNKRLKQNLAVMEQKQNEVVKNHEEK